MYGVAESSVRYDLALRVVDVIHIVFSCRGSREEILAVRNGKRSDAAFDNDVSGDLTVVGDTYYVIVGSGHIEVLVLVDVGDHSYVLNCILQVVLVCILHSGANHLANLVVYVLKLGYGVVAQIENNSNEVVLTGGTCSEIIILSILVECFRILNKDAVSAEREEGDQSFVIIVMIEVCVGGECIVRNGSELVVVYLYGDRVVGLVYGVVVVTNGLESGERGHKFNTEISYEYSVAVLVVLIEGGVLIYEVVFAGGLVVIINVISHLVSVVVIEVATIGLPAGEICAVKLRSCLVVDLYGVCSVDSGIHIEARGVVAAGCGIVDAVAFLKNSKALIADKVEIVVGIHIARLALGEGQNASFFCKIVYTNLSVVVRHLLLGCDKYVTGFYRIALEADR